MTAGTRDAHGATVGALADLGTPETRPASAILGVRVGGASRVETRGWALLPGEGRPGVPMTRDTMIDLASVTKVAATTTVFLRLVSAGAVDLDARVRAFLPGFTGGGRDDVTIRHLLTHTAGLPPWQPLYLAASEPDEALRLIAGLPLDARPGTAWAYSDLGMMLAGAVIEHVTATSLRGAYETLVAGPLALTSRFGPVAPERAAASADSDAYEHHMVASGTPYPVTIPDAGFSAWRTAPVRGEPNDGNAAHAFGGAAGHAGLFATVDDLLALGAALCGGGFVPADLLREFSAATPVHPEQAVGFRRAIVVTSGGDATVLWHGGFTGTAFALAPDHDVVVACGAMRLYGTLGPIGATPHADLVTGAEIRAVALDAVRAEIDAALPDGRRKGADR